MLSGEATHSFDAKYRVTIPAKYRDDLGTEFWITKGTKCYLDAFPVEYWEDLKEKLKKLPKNQLGNRYRRHLAGSAEPVSLDKMGRVIIPAALREYAHLTDDVVMVGQIDHLEIWDKQLWAAENMETAASIEELADQLIEQGYEL